MVLRVYGELPALKISRGGRRGGVGWGGGGVGLGVEWSGMEWRVAGWVGVWWSGVSYQHFKRMVLRVCGQLPTLNMNGLKGWW